jgi:hypothetical protein
MLEEKVNQLQDQLQRLKGASILADSASSAGPSPSSGDPSPAASTSSVARRSDGTVSILNVDPEQGSAPQSFTVVSSLLQETFWGQNRDNADQRNGNDRQGVGLLPDYDFQEYLKYRPAKPPDEKAGQALLASFLSGAQGRFPFIDRRVLRKIHDERFNRPANLDDPLYRFNSFILYTVYAIASVSHTPTPGEDPEFEPFGYYATALNHARMCKSKNVTWQITTLILCAMFQMRTDKDHGCHYDMVRRSMKICVEINLHKGAGLEELSVYDQEMQRRLFWSVYSLERLFAISTGRPFVMDEKEIEIDFAADVDDDDLENAQLVEEARNAPEDSRPTTSLTFIVYIWRLRRLESELVQAIYRLDHSIEERFSHVDYYLDALRNWKDSNRVHTPKEQNITMTAYARGIRLLLQPFLGRLSPDSDLFQMCVRETGRICNVFRDFYRKKESGFTTMAMHTNFVAGLTLVYCLWLAKDAAILPILENIRSCTSTLYVLTERSKLCMNYRDTFENLVATTMKHVIEHRRLRHQLRIQQELQQRKQLEERQEELERQQQERPSLSSAPSEQSIYSMDQRLAMAPNRYRGALPVKAEEIIGSDAENVTVTEPTGYALTGSISTGGAVYGPPQTASITNRKDWIEAYGYDDKLYNMIQDISSWTRQVGDSTAMTNGAGTGQGPSLGVTAEAPNWLTDTSWMNISDFGYS